MADSLRQEWWTKLLQHFSSPAVPAAAYTAEQRKTRKTELEMTTPAPPKKEVR